jgi:circadian clock protein KaiC
MKMTENGESENALPQPLTRVPTGIRGLDSILRGGFLSGGVYVIAGSPGTGKTILASQICYNHVAAGNRAVFVSLLAESHSRMFGHLQSQAFFDPKVISRELLYVSAYQVLEEAGLSGLLQTLGELLTAQEATLLVIDGLLTADTVAPWQAEYQKFIQGLQSICELMSATTLLLSKHQHDPARTHSQHTMVDGILELEDTEIGPQVVREITVKKFRGSSYLRGRHMFRITDQGVVVYPRTEKIYEVQGAPKTYTENVTFGIEGLDKALHGGVQMGSTTMMLGAPGSGKTLCGLHFLGQGVADGQPGLYMGFDESPTRIIATAESIGLPFKQAVEKGQLTMLWNLPVELYLDEISERLIDTIKEKQVKRLFLDGLSALVKASIYPARLPAFMATLTNLLRGMGVTTIFTLETHAILSPSIELPIDSVSVLVENMILVGHVEYAAQLERQITILKVRQHAFDSAIRRLIITESGVQVGDAYHGVRGMLTGQAFLDYQHLHDSVAPEAYEDNSGH